MALWSTRNARLGRGCLLVLAAVSCAASTGCVGRWRPPPLPQVPSTQPAGPINVGAYIHGNQLGRWVYERRELPAHPDRPVTEYARTITAWRLREGAFEQRTLLPIASYLYTRRQEAPTSRPSERPTLARMHGVLALFELGDPMSPLPAELEAGQTIANATTIRYFDHAGRPASTGTLTRTARVEGLETVSTPAGTFADCLRVRVDLSVQFPWGPLIDWTSYLWLSAKGGEVRRINRLSGWFWIFPFDSAHEYRLVSYTPAATGSATAGSAPAGSPSAGWPAWSRAALLLDRTIPRPQIGGLVVDFAR